MLNKFQQLWRAKDVRNNIVYVLVLLIIFRIAAHIPVPGVNVGDLTEIFKQNQVLGLLNIINYYNFHKIEFYFLNPIMR